MSERVTLMENKHFSDLNPILYGNEACRPLHHSETVYPVYVQLHYVISGTGTVTVNGVTHTVHQGQAFLRTPGIPISYTADEKDPWHYCWISFTGTLSRKFLELPTVFNCPREPFDRMEKVFTMTSMQEEYLASCLFLLYIALFRDEKAENPVLKVKNYLDLHYSRQIKIEEVAAMVNLDRHYLSRIFKKQMGVSMQAYLTNLRMQQAKIYLTHGYTVGETASLLSYSDQFAFCKAFKNYYGCAPSKLQEP